MSAFDDFLGLESVGDWSQFRLVLFHGRSGSGKSTAIRFLLDGPFHGRPVQRIIGPPFPEERCAVRDPSTVAVIDEITCLGDLLGIRHVLRSDGTLLVATHVPPLLIRLLGHGPAAVFRTDRHAAKIARHLARHGIAASRAAVDAYVRTFGATYTDADLIMERWPSQSFDQSLARFLKHDRIDWCGRSFER